MFQLNLLKEKDKMVKGKLEAQVGVKEDIEFKAGKLEQQKGVRPTVAYTIKKRKYTEAVAKQKRIEKEIQSFKAKDLTYSTYETEYKKLSSEAKKYLTTPSEVKATPEYKKYESYLSEKERVAEYNKAVETLKRAIQQDKVWAYASYGTGTVKELAQEYLKEKKQFEKLQEPEQLMSIAPSKITAADIFGLPKPPEPKEFFKQYITEKPKQPSLEVPKTKQIPFPVYSESKFFPTVQAVKKPEGFLKGISAGISERRGAYETEVLRGKEVSLKERGTQFGFSFAAPFVETGIFAKQLVTKPIKTTIEFGKGIYSIGGKIVSGEGFPGLGQRLKVTSPESLVGRGVGEVAVFKGITATPKIILKGSDIFRTRGLIELPKESVIAPEYFAGQTFPKIVKGQKAGELLKEFKPVEQYGVTSLRGFTAAPKPFKKITEALIGTSELPGIYQAPKISPRFLRIGGETGQKLFSWNIFDTFRPSVMKITPRGFKLVSGVSPSRREMFSLPKAKEFFKTAPKGRSYLPFIKTEKEAIIPFGTLLKRERKRFYFEFEGRKIPISEYETILSNGKKISIKEPKIKESKFKTIEELSSKVSSRKIGRSGKYSPLSFVPPSRMVYKTKPSSSFLKSSVGKSIISSSIKPISSIKGSISGRKGISYKTPKRISSMGLPPSSYRKVPRITRTPLGRVFYRTDKDFFKRIKTSKLKKRKGVKVYRKPSLVAVGLNIKAPKIKGKETAFSIRPIITKKKKKRRK